jgi:hypothetical protein
MGWFRKPVDLCGSRGFKSHPLRFNLKSGGQVRRKTTIRVVIFCLLLAKQVVIALPNCEIFDKIEEEGPRRQVVSCEGFSAIYFYY